MINFTSFKPFLMVSLLFLCSFNTYENCDELEEDAAVSVIRICNFAGGNNLSPPSCQWEITMDENTCTGIITGKSFIANLSTVPPTPYETYSMPQNMPDLYFQYSINGGTPQITSQSYNEFIFHNETHPANPAHGEPFYFIYDVDITIDINLDGQCEEAGVNAEVPIEITMVDQFGNVYPVDSYANPNEVYSCKVFVETCHTCNPNFCLVNEPEPIYFGKACGECTKTCDGPIFTPQWRTDSDEEIRIEISKLKENILNEEDIFNFTIQPNPFSKNFTIQYHAENTTNIEIEILDIKGQRILYTLKKLNKGFNSIDIESSSCKQGIYFCKIKTPTKIITKKIIKLD